ncbi:MAG: hypothetical protein K2P58_08400, partial [Hyphomonadaceae bacterium]|nr:hypothetical protein [Hyphomonadaceae bacterium]
MIAQIAQWVRETAAAQDWLSWAGPYLAQAPDWALVIPAPVLAVLLAAWTIGNAKRTTEEAVERTQEGLSIMTAGAIKPPAKPANVDHVKALEAQVQALSDAQRAKVAALEAKLDQMNAALVAAGKAQPIGAEEKAKRNEAVVGVVAEGGAAADSFEASVLAGGKLDLEALKADARADAARAAEKWRRVAALARGVNDGEALAAYEEAHKLQPDDFWTCVELSQLYRRWKGDLAAAKHAAEAARRVAQDDRDRSVADNTLGDVLVLGGDLEGAKARFEASLVIA